MPNHLKQCLVIYYIAALLFLLTGCSSSSSRSIQPALTIPNQWIKQKAQSKEHKNTPLAELAWWQQFNDPQLNQLIQQGLQQNNHILLASANLDYAQAQLKQVKLAWIPSVNLWAGYSSLPYLGNPGYFFGLFPNYILNVFQQLKMQKSARYQVEASQYARSSVRLATIAQISGSYFTLLAQTQSLRLYDQLLADNKKLLIFYEWQYRTGIIPEDNLDNLQSEIKKIKAQMTMTQHNILVSKNALRYLLNQNPGNITLTTSFEHLKSNAVIPGDLPVSVLNNRPDVHQAAALLKSAQANIGVATSNLLPSIKLDNLLLDSSHAHGGVSLNEAYVNIPLLTPTVFGQISASHAQYQAAYVRYVDTVQAALRDVENDFSAYSAYSQRLKENEAAFKNEQTACHLSQIRYKEGIDSGIESNLCVINLDHFALSLNQDKLEKMMVLVALYQDLGGGYDET